MGYDAGMTHETPYRFPADQPEPERPPPTRDDPEAVYERLATQPLSLEQLRTALIHADQLVIDRAEVLTEVVTDRADIEVLDSAWRSLIAAIGDRTALQIEIRSRIGLS